MRTFEILTLILTIGALTALLYHKDRRIFLYLIFGAILTILMQFFIEGIRWQFTFIIYFLPAMYIAHKLKAKEINVTTKTVREENIDDSEEYLNINETTTHVNINSKPN